MKTKSKTPGPAVGNTVDLEIHFLKTPDDIQRRYSLHPTHISLPAHVVNQLLGLPIEELKAALLRHLYEFLVEDPWMDGPFLIRISKKPAFWSLGPVKKRPLGIIHLDVATLHNALARFDKGGRMAIALEGLQHSWGSVFSWYCRGEATGRR